MEWHIYRGESMKELTSFLQKPDVIVCSVVLVLLLIGYRFGGMRYTSVKEIIKNYLSCFSDDNGRILFLPVVYYFGVPLLVSIVAALKHEMDGNIINTVTVVVSNFTTLPFNLLMLVIDMKSKIQKDPEYYSMDARTSKKALIGAYYAIMFAILVSVGILIICLFNVFVKTYGLIQSICLYYLLFLLLINLFMILKKIYKVIDTDMNK